MDGNITAAPVLHISDLSKAFGYKQILRNITLDIQPGEIFGFLGPNGAGKTTTIKIMLGLLRIDSGEVSICGFNIVSDFEKALDNVGCIIENPEMYKYLTGRQNLLQYSRMYDNVSSERIDEVIKLVHLEDRINDKISKYSLGMKQRLGLAQSLLNHPKLLVLDEPTNGLDPVGIKELRDILKELSHSENVSVFVSSHQLAELDQLCDRVGIIDRGNMICIKTMEEIRNGSNTNNDIFELSVTDIGAAASLLEQNGTAFRIDNDKIIVTTEKGGTPSVIKMLALQDIAITGAVPVKHSLEDTFIELTKPFGNGGEVK